MERARGGSGRGLRDGRADMGAAARARCRRGFRGGPRWQPRSVPRELRARRGETAHIHKHLH
eukprot:3590446-Pyramimonas_sp.AAC.1